MSIPEEIVEAHTHWTYICTTQNLVIEDWRRTKDGPPTQCLYGSGHAVDWDTLNNWGELSPRTVHVQHVNESSIKQRARYRGGTLEIGGGVNTIESTDITFNMNVAIKMVSTETVDAQQNDIVSCYRNWENPYPGAALTSDYTAGDEWINVNADFLNSPVCDEGMLFILDDGTNKENMGEIHEIDKDNSRIKTTIAATNNYASGNTIIRFSVPIAENYILGPGRTYQIGRETLNSSFLPKGQSIKLFYQNKSADPKVFYYHLAFFW